MCYRSIRTTISHILLPSQVFQQLVELKESGRILNDLANGNTRRDHAFNEMREIMESWRWVRIALHAACYVCRPGRMVPRYTRHDPFRSI